MPKPNQQFTQMLHFVTSLDEHRRMVSFCCESQPLATVRSYGVPVRCPFCQQASPIDSKQKTGCEVEMTNTNSRVKSSRHREEL
jgi:hypothetical protein